MNNLRWNHTSMSTNSNELKIPIQENSPTCICLQENRHGDKVLKLPSGYENMWESMSSLFLVFFSPHVPHFWWLNEAAKLYIDRPFSFPLEKWAYISSAKTSHKKIEEFQFSYLLISKWIFFWWESVDTVCTAWWRQHVYTQANFFIFFF